MCQPHHNHANDNHRVLNKLSGNVYRLDFRIQDFKNMLRFVNVVQVPYMTSDEQFKKESEQNDVSLHMNLSETEV